MGARPIAILNSLRFGKPSNPKVRHIFRRVVKGIADYGNSFGVPTVAGEVYFDDSYRDNPLLNAMAVGIVEKNKISKAVAKGSGNTVMIVGSKTGRDGIHGATFASEEISEKSEAKRPSVQVGDPFVGKMLLESTLEAIASGYLIGVQDMGAAGITCSTAEMSARGKSGMVIDLEKIPLREKNMTPYEILLSESQERMLFIVKKGHEEDIAKIFHKFDIEAESIGIIEDSSDITIKLNDEIIAKIPADSLVLGGGAPAYVREINEPKYIEKCRKYDLESLPIPKDLDEIILKLIMSPSIANKKWVFEQYDSMVRTNSVMQTESDAAIVRIKGSNKGLALTTDCNARYVYLNPRRGAQIAVAEAARNVSSVGATPIAITNCLNFGNPYDPEIYWQFNEVIIGMRDACEVFSTPVTGGNVSFYNEGPNGAIHPTPVIGMLGLLDDVQKAVDSQFKEPGNIILELGINKSEIGGSEYLELILGEVVGEIPFIDLEYENRIHKLCQILANNSLVQSIHDISDGGLAIALLECVNNINSGLGCSITLKNSDKIRYDALIFSESQSRVIVSCKPDKFVNIIDAAKNNKIDINQIGVVTGDNYLKIDSKININLDIARKIYNESLNRVMKRKIE
jgi:phosphoribosylformylglycinamidine synthase